MALPKGGGTTAALRTKVPRKVIQYFQDLRQRQTGKRPSEAAVLKNETFKLAWRQMKKSRGKGPDSVKGRAMVALGLRQWDWFWNIGETPK